MRNRLLTPVALSAGLFLGGCTGAIDDHNAAFQNTNAVASEHGLSRECVDVLREEPLLDEVTSDSPIVRANCSGNTSVIPEVISLIKQEDRRSQRVDRNTTLLLIGALTLGWGGIYALARSDWTYRN